MADLFDGISEAAKTFIRESSYEDKRDIFLYFVRVGLYPNEYHALQELKEKYIHDAECGFFMNAIGNEINHMAKDIL